MANDLAITQRHGLGVATVMGRRSTDRLILADALGIALPHGPTASIVGDLTLLGTGPSNWLAVKEQPGPDWFDDLCNAAGSLASLSDQSSGYVVWRLSGEAARTLLQRGASIDFNSMAFKTGAVAVTMIAHIGVIIWQVDDTPAYDIALFRSFATSFERWLASTAAAL